jgi:hypothetical protein
MLLLNIQACVFCTEKSKGDKAAFHRHCIPISQLKLFHCYLVVTFLQLCKIPHNFTKRIFSMETPTSTVQLLPRYTLLTYIVFPLLLTACSPWKMSLVCSWPEKGKEDCTKGRKLQRGNVNHQLQGANLLL